MCGIGGVIFGKNNYRFDEFIQNSFNRSQLHRGPNNQNIYIENNLSFSHQRLSIIDIKNGNQPMHSKNGMQVIIFNGEIYNYRQLKKTLEDKGVHFETNSDTEVILKGYELKGEVFFKELKGMFAIAIHDKPKNQVLLIRDRTGEKPLYYSITEKHIAFGSELKSILELEKGLSISKKEINLTAVKLFFQLTYIPAPYTIYQNIFKLEPGKILRIDTQTLAIEEHFYWDISQIDQSAQLNDFELAKKEIKKKLFEIVENQMVSEVPVGSFLSGGVDSSIVSAVMSSISTKAISTFSIGFENPSFDETNKSDLVAKHLHTNHHNYLLSVNEIKNDLEKIILNFDEPFADSSALPTYFVSKKTKEQVTVALTGDGGDELFGGYNRYFMPKIGNKYRKIVPYYLHQHAIKPLSKLIHQNRDSRGKVFKLQKLIASIGANEEEDIKNIISMGFKSDELNDLFISQTVETSPFFDNIFQRSSDFSGLNKSRVIDYLCSLEGDMLVKVDRTSMLNSLECRSPFLDHNLIEFSFRLPEKFLIHKNETKYILKKTFEDLLPKNIFNQSKSGFGVPIGDWLRTDLKNQLLEFASKEFITDQQLFNFKYIQKLVANHLNKTSDQTFKVWCFYCFQLWYAKKFINEA